MCVPDRCAAFALWPSDAYGKPFSTPSLILGALLAAGMAATASSKKRGSRRAPEWGEQDVDKLSRAVEQAADSVLISNRDGVIEYVNPAFEQMTGYSRDEVIGATPRILRSGLQNAEFYNGLWNTILSGQTFRAVMTNRKRSGELYDEDQTISPIRDAEGGITHFVSCGRDITQRKRAQAALQRLNQQLEREAERVASVLHDEAGQFLTAAHITLAAITREVDGRAAERLAEVREHLVHVEERLRQLSHEIHPRIVQDLGLEGAVRFLADSFSRRTGVRVSLNARITRRYSPHIESVLYRVVQEGLTNINRHAQARVAQVSIVESEDSVSCVLSDDGAGFDTSRLASPGNATGLGLRLMQDRIEAVGGTISISSAPGQGAELRARVPVEHERGV
jgi:PAS domain S-box-containing protein